LAVKTVGAALAARPAISLFEALFGIDSPLARGVAAESHATPYSYRERAWRLDARRAAVAGGFGRLC
jgi:hypothetical protein